MPILLILLFAAAIEKAIIFTGVHFCFFNEFEVPVSQPAFKIVKEREEQVQSLFLQKWALSEQKKNGYGSSENTIEGSTLDF